MYCPYRPLGGQFLYLAHFMREISNFSVKLFFKEDLYNFYYYFVQFKVLKFLILRYSLFHYSGFLVDM